MTGPPDSQPVWRHLLTPKWRPASLFEITAERLAARGIAGVMLDMDNTLVEWRAEAAAPEIVAWMAELHAAGLKTCIVSNTNRTERLARLCDALGVDYVRGVAKPFRRGFRLALEKLGTPAERTAIVGDQIFTDVLGGNRMGLVTILVPPLSPEEFAGTRWISRRLERLLFAHLERTRRLPPDR